MPTRETISQVVPGERRTMTTLESGQHSRARRSVPTKRKAKEVEPDRKADSEQVQPRASFFARINLAADDLLLLLLIILLRDEGYGSDILFMLLIWLFIDGLWT